MRAILEPRRPGHSDDPKGRPAPVDRVPSAGPSPAGDEAALIAKARGGDREAFRVLVDRYHRRAYWAAFHLVGNADDAMEIAQEGFLKAYRALDSFDTRRRFFTWLYQIVTNLAIDHLRRRAKRLHASLDAAEGDEHEPEAPDDGGPGARLEAAETRERVRRVLDRLSAPYRAVLVLRELEGLPCDEIARIVGTTSANVRWRLHRARMLFRKAWEAAGYGEE